MKLSRILQPRNPMFWMCVALNALSPAISFILRSQELPVLVTLLLAGFAIANVVLGLPIALRLMPDPESIQVGLPASRTRGKEVLTPSHASGADLPGRDKCCSVVPSDNTVANHSATSRRVQNSRRFGEEGLHWRARRPPRDRPESLPEWSRGLRHQSSRYP